MEVDCKYWNEGFFLFSPSIWHVSDPSGPSLAFMVFPSSCWGCGSIYSGESEPIRFLHDFHVRICCKYSDYGRWTAGISCRKGRFSITARFNVGGITRL